VVVDGRHLRVKVTAGRVKAEADDAARVAAELGRPLREVLARAEEAWRQEHPVDAVASQASEGRILAFGPWVGAHGHDGDDHPHLHHPHPEVDPPGDDAS
jgi:hypothetical protein